MSYLIHIELKNQLCARRCRYSCRQLIGQTMKLQKNNQQSKALMCSHLLRASHVWSSQTIYTPDLSSGICLPSSSRLYAGSVEWNGCASADCQTWALSSKTQVCKPTKAHKTKIETKAKQIIADCWFFCITFEEHQQRLQPYMYANTASLLSIQFRCVFQ